MRPASPSSFPPPAPDLATRILGLWRLLSREDFDDQGRRHIDPILGPAPLGILTFGPTRFAAQFMNPDRRVTTPAAASQSNNSGALNGYDAYSGSYELDPAASTVTVRLEAGLSPPNIGQVFVRDIRATADNLWIRLRTTATDGTPITRTLTFVRDGAGAHAP